MDKKTLMYKRTIKIIHHTECSPAPLCIHVHIRKDMTTLFSWLAVCYLLYSIITADVKLPIKQRYVMLWNGSVYFLERNYGTPGTRWSTADL